MAGSLGRYPYVSDNGETYTMRLDASNATAVGATPTGPGTAFPKGWVPRYVTVMHPTTRRERRIVVPDPTAAMWTGTGGVLSLRDYDTNAAVDFLVMGRVGERRYARAV